MNDESGPVVLREPLDALVRDQGGSAPDLRFLPAEQIRVYDDTLRDGEQMPGVALSPAVKYEIARRLSEIGVHCADVGFPAVSPSERQTLKLVLEGRRRGELRHDMEIVCMARCSHGDIRTTVSAVEELGFAPDSITYLIFTSGSDLHLKYKLGPALLRHEGRSMEDWLELPLGFYRDANVCMVTDAIRYARSLGAGAIEYGAEDGSRADVGYLEDLHRAAAAAGATRLALADTVGSYSPFAAREAVSRLVAAVPDVPLSLHFHNDLAVGAWNTVMGLASGAQYFMTSINGIGERSGNASMHQVVMQLRYLFGIELPGFRYDRLRELARLLERRTGVPVAPTEPGIGMNVFSHESGLHTAGMLIHPSIYQFIAAADWGAEVSYVYGKHSGGLAIEHALRSAGLDGTPALVDRVMTEVKRIREERAEREDFAAFHDAYYGHLAGLGMSTDEVVTLGRALSAAPARER
jgi:2-isopropylmalate synthase